ncbi:hypothetical protein Tco_0798755 [Tanacetum coccineum]
MVGSYALSWKPCQRGSSELSLPNHSFLYIVSCVMIDHYVTLLSFRHYRGVTDWYQSQGYRELDNASKDEDPKCWPAYCQITRRGNKLVELERVKDLGEWNSQIYTLSREVTVSVSWNDFKFMMIEEFCPSHEMQKLEIELWNHAMVGAGHAAYTDRWLEATEPKTMQKAVQISGALTDEAIRNGSIKKVEKKRNVGNLARIRMDFRGVPRNVNLVNARNPTVRACYECGSTDHVSFVSTTLIPLLGIEPSELGFRYEIEIASGQLVKIDKVIKECKLEIKGHVFDIDLIPFGHGSFDVIIGNIMDEVDIENLTIEQYLELTQENHAPSVGIKVDDMTIAEYLEYEETIKTQDYDDYQPQSAKADIATKYRGHLSPRHKSHDPPLDAKTNPYFLSPIHPKITKTPKQRSQSARKLNEQSNKA